MRLITKYRQLSASERQLLIQALFLVAAIRIALWTIPFKWTQAGVDRFRKSATSYQNLNYQRIQRVVWAVTAASRRIYGATCLTQGLATQFLLGRLGQASELQFGVALTTGGLLEAHAWVEIRGRIVCGGAIKGFKRYARLQKKFRDTGSTNNSYNRHTSKTMVDSGQI